MKKFKVFAVLAVLVFCFPPALSAQFEGFGKNKVVWEKNKDNF